MSVEKIIKENPYLKKLLETMPEDVKKRSILKEFYPTDILLKKDEEAKYVYLLYSGTLRVINEFPNGTVYGFAYIDSTEIIGALEILAEEKRIAATVEAVTHSIALRISKEDFIKWFESSIDFSMIMARMLAKKFYPTISKNGEVFMNSSMHSLASFIIRSVEKNIKEGKIGIINKKRQYIADELGMSLRTVYRAIKKLKEDNLITIIKGKIHVSKKQYEKLTEIIDEYI
jgi:CRP/FNR family cyclic AMP-dependent transcriptional regulator